MKTNKILFIALGGIIAFTGFLTYNNDLQNIVVSTLFFLAGLLLLLTVAWRKLNDGKVDLNDVSSLVSLALAVFVIIAGIFIAMGTTIPAWMNILVVVAMVVVGLTIALVGVKSK